MVEKMKIPTTLEDVRALTAERDATLSRLEKRWTWLDEHPDHSLFGDREDAALEDLALYEQQEDALSAAIALTRKECRKVSDVVVTVPKRLWDEWIAEGDLPDDPETGVEYGFDLYGPRPHMLPGDRVYIVAHGKLRGYAPLTRIHTHSTGFALVRSGGAVACTIDRPIRGFRGWQYRDWEYSDEMPFPEWRTP